MTPEIHLIGLNHKTACVEVREKFALTDKESPEGAFLGGPIRECLVLSTCNRVEIAVIADPGLDVQALVLSRWAELCAQLPEGLHGNTYVYSGMDAVNHLFEVASSLDSMVVGEPQILGQLKEAYRRALDAGSAKAVLSRLMHKAFFVAKKVRTTTDIASSAVSISYAAVELAKRIFGELAGKTAMLVGAGEMAELAAQHLLSAGVSKVYVANRTFSRGQELAERMGGEAVAFADMLAYLPKTDVIISSTGATEAVIRARDVRPALKKRKNKPMFFIDIAVPRDIDPDVNALDNAYLYDIDDLKEVVEENLAQRQEEAAKARTIIHGEVERFAEWLDALDLEPTIKDLLASGREIGDRELAKTMKRLGDSLDDDGRQALEKLVESLVCKLYREPIVFLKRRDLEEDAKRRYVDVTRRMFNLDEEAVPEDAHADRRRTAERDESPDDEDTQ